MKARATMLALLLFVCFSETGSLGGQGCSQSQILLSRLNAARLYGRQAPLAFEGAKISEHWLQESPRWLLLLGSAQCFLGDPHIGPSYGSVTICDTFTPESANKTYHQVAEVCSPVPITPHTWEDYGGKRTA